MKSMKNYLKDVYIPEELTVSEEELKEEHKALYEDFKRSMREINPDIPAKVIREQFNRYFKKH